MPLSPTCKHRLLVLSCSLAIFLLATVASGKEVRPIIGATAVLHVTEAKLDFLSRTDTGARTTSIHATDLQILNGEKDKKKNIGKQISFTVTNSEGQSRTLTLPIAEVTQVRNAQGVEHRYQVPLHLQWKGLDKKILVNLRDRSNMTYKLLIGRDFLSGMLVDVNKDK